MAAAVGSTTAKKGEETELGGLRNVQTAKRAEHRMPCAVGLCKSVGVSELYKTEAPFCLIRKRSESRERNRTAERDRVAELAAELHNNSAILCSSASFADPQTDFAKTRRPCRGSERQFDRRAVCGGQTDRTPLRLKSQSLAPESNGFHYLIIVTLFSQL